MSEEPRSPDLGELSRRRLAAVNRFVSELDEVLDLGHGVLFQSVTQRGRLAGSEGEIRQHSARVSVLVAGLIERPASFNDIDEARSVAERLAEGRG
jgi:hypothetical protein